MNGYYKMQTFEQLQRVRLVPRTAQAGKGVLFQPGYIAAADAELCGNLLLRLRDGAIQAVPQGQNLLLALRQGGNQLAQLSGVSKATVSRLFKRLGYDKYKDMRDELRTLRQSGMPLTDQRDAVQGNTLLARHYKQEMANLTQWVNALDARQFAEALTAMVAARRIVVIGMRNAYPAALHLRQQLLQARGQVLVLPSRVRVSAKSWSI